MVLSEYSLVSSLGFGIIDSGCSKTLTGQTTLNELFRLYEKRGSSCHAFADRTICLPLETTKKSGPAPLLLSRSTLKNLGATLDFGEGTLSLNGGEPQILQVNSAGQFMINILNFPARETLMCEQPDADQAPSPSIRPAEAVEIMAGSVKQLTKLEARCVESNKHAWQKGKSKCLVAELSSPPGFALAGKAKGYLGFSFDIQQGHDLLKKDVHKQVSQQLVKKNLGPNC